jgi:hypothetical protein
MSVKTQPLNPAAIRELGLDALNEKLGPVGAAEFMRLYGRGYGDYAEERGAWRDKMTLEDIVAGIKEMRLAKNAGG